MQICPAIRRDFSAMARAGKSEFSTRARAAAKAKLPPLPMAAIPSSGSMTSPDPLIRNVCLRSATTSRASRLRSILSVRQSLANSTAERPRLPAYCSSLASKRLKSEKASAVDPAKPARILSWYNRRIFRAECLITLSPSVTWPSAAMTTLELRRTHRTVVERIRRPSEREFTLEAALEPAVAVEPRTTDERIDISVEYSAGTLVTRMLPNGVQRVYRFSQDAPPAISCS